MMNLQSRNQYMETLREQYLKASKQEKGHILDEYCKNTHQDRKYVMKKFRYKARVLKEGEHRKARSEKYDGQVRAALVVIWGIFDYPCGQRLKPIMEDELERLRNLGEVVCSDEVAHKLQEISPAEIDRSLVHEKEVLHLRENRGTTRNPLLYSKVPTKTSGEMARDKPGRIQVDCVEHCGVSAAGEFVLSLTTTDIYSGWWEGDAVMGKGQARMLHAIDEARTRSPFPWIEMHPDNGGNIMNIHVYEYATKHGVELSRSRPYKKNDNCFVEQKNSTHVRKVFGHKRYDTERERAIMHDLYTHELRLYKNFFQPVMKLTEKIRIKGKIHRKYDIPKTPYQRVLESPFVPELNKQELRALYQTLNPAELKRTIDRKISELHNIHQKKYPETKVEIQHDKKVALGVIVK